MTTPTVPTVTDELIAELEAAANSATPGPWEHATDIGQVGSVDVGDDVLAQTQHLRYGGNSQRNKNAAYIAAANPATIKALLAERADLKQQLAAASVDAQMLAYARNVISREWRPGSAGASAAKALLIHKLDVQLSCAARAAAGD